MLINILIPTSTVFLFPSCQFSSFLSFLFICQFIFIDDNFHTFNLLSFMLIPSLLKPCSNPNHSLYYPYSFFLGVFLLFFSLHIVGAPKPLSLAYLDTFLFLSFVLIFIQLQISFFHALAFILITPNSVLCTVIYPQLY